MIIIDHHYLDEDLPERDCSSLPVYRCLLELLGCAGTAEVFTGVDSNNTDSSIVTLYILSLATSSSNSFILSSLERIIT